tara:strand:- start:1324 stop:1902 length:579 start_codon:yes stop_codon:yes gene_type:complete
MALTQFNEWEPQLDPVNGRQAQEPRVFAHDAHAVVVGAVNNSDANHGISITVAGLNYQPGDTVTLSAPAAGGPLDRAILTVLAINKDTGAITDYEVTTPGALYAINEVVLQSATSGVGAGFFGAVTNIDIPNTQKRGCCVYVGAAAGLTSLTVVMESGNTATFKTVSGGTILPILIKRVTSTITTNDVIALY